MKMRKTYGLFAPFRVKLQVPTCQANQPRADLGTRPTKFQGEKIGHLSGKRPKGKKFELSQLRACRAKANALTCQVFELALFFYFI